MRNHVQNKQTNKNFNKGVCSCVERCSERQNKLNCKVTSELPDSRGLHEDRLCGGEAELTSVGWLGGWGWVDISLAERVM